MATTAAYGAAATFAVEAATSPCSNLHRAWRPRLPPRSLVFLSQWPLRWASILQPPGHTVIHRVAPRVEEYEGPEGPSWVELEPMGSEQQLDRALAEGQQLGLPIVLLWMASWCRKCIYLKPKLEKLAAEYHPRIQFYCVDVNTVPQKLVNRAGVTKMPAIQLWYDSQKQAEVIGGHKSWLVIDDVRRMIEQE